MADLFETIGAGDVDRLRDLLDRDPGLAGARNEAGLSPVLHALYTGHAELADVLLYLVRLSSVLQIDLNEAVSAKLASNGLKYPAGNSTLRRSDLS